jgi:hypothetical protein
LASSVAENIFANFCVYGDWVTVTIPFVVPVTQTKVGSVDDLDDVVEVDEVDTETVAPITTCKNTNI